MRTKPDNRGEMVLDALRAIRALANGRWQIDDLAGELGVKRRTAYRVLETLGRIGVEVQREPEGKCVYLKIDRKQAVRALGL